MTHKPITIDGWLAADGTARIALYDGSTYALTSPARYVLTMTQTRDLIADIKAELERLEAARTESETN